MLKKINNIQSPNDLYEVWEESCIYQLKKKSLSGLSIGIEIEFFLQSGDQRLADLDDSQRFFRRLKEIFANKDPGLRVENEEINEKDCIFALKYQTSKNSWISISYEYSPHLLEVSFNHQNNLHKIKENMNMIFNDLEQAARSSKLQLNFNGLLSEEEIKSISNALNKSQKDLQESRLQMLNQGPYANDTKLANFPSYLAATHIHISGYAWWEDQEFINRLYSIEPFLMLEAKGVNFKERWSLYYKLFNDFSLVGFPNYQKWNLQEWIQALYNESYLPSKEKVKNFNSINKLRDLQIIRPRAIGTIEFRSDSAQKTVDSILRLAALRLGQYILAQKPLEDFFPDYKSARELWLNQMNSGKDFDESTKKKVFDRIKNALKDRDQGEELFITQED